jgi:hypothetical protein
MSAHSVIVFEQRHIEPALRPERAASRAHTDSLD